MVNGREKTKTLGNTGIQKTMLTLLESSVRDAAMYRKKIKVFVERVLKY